MVPDELAAAVGENGRTARKTRTVLLAPVGREPSDAAVVCQYVGADRWTAASVGIAQAAAPKKTMPLSPRYGELSEKAGSGCPGDGFSGRGKGGKEAVGTAW